MKSVLDHNCYPRTISDLVLLHRNKLLNLNPGFQRKSVWSLKDRKKLIESILRNYPLPAIFLYKREENGKIIYDVIDGKQRLESILMFIGELRGNRFSIKSTLKEDEDIQDVDWNLLKRKGKQTLVTDFKLYTIQIDGDFSDIIDLFVRINSTGKALTSAEKQHARYYNSQFLKTAAAVANKFESYFNDNGIMSAGQISRMKHIELICEIMVSVANLDVINKKAAMDKIMSKGLTANQIQKTKEKTIKAINRIRTSFPNLHETRFTQLSDYYCLAVLIAIYEEEHLILIDRKRNKIAFELLTNFSNGIDQVRIKQRRAENFDESENSYREYLLTVLSGTDEVTQRRKRLKILDGLLRNLFESKDKQRIFSPEQRRVIWNSTAEKKCSTCGVKLTWENFTIDHINPHSRGGKTTFTNSALLCRTHNSSKGNK
jgi:hypothetical protein